MAYIVGLVLALAAGVFATVVRLDRDRGFYPTVMIVIGCLYSLFAVMGGSNKALVLEVLAGAVFVAAAVAGLRTSLWIVVIALAGHGVFDFVHPRLIDDPGVPVFWPQFCSAYDIAAAAYLAGLLKLGRIEPSPVGV